MHIATWRALTYLAAVVRQYKPKTVLEYGAGIGTLTYLLLSANPRLDVVGVESNPFCLAQLQQNIPDEFKPRLTVVTPNDARLKARFDLIVIDTVFEPNNYPLHEGTICFIEGNRRAQAASLMQMAKAKNLVCDLEKQSFGLFSVRWRKKKLRLRWRRHRARIRFRLPAFEPVKKKTCRIGILARAPGQ